MFFRRIGIGVLLFFACGTEGLCLTQTVKLTESEKHWREAHPNIVLGFTDAWEPFLIVEKDGRHTGVLIDFLDELNRRLGMNIQVKLSSWEDTQRKAQQKEVDGILGIYAGTADKLGLLRTETYINTYDALYTRQKGPGGNLDAFKGGTVAVVSGNRFAEELLAPYSEEIKIRRTDNTLSALQMLLDGEADALIGQISHNYLITKYQLAGIRQSYVWWQRPIHIVMGVRNDWHELVSILNKGISSFSRQELDGYVSNWVHMPMKRPDLELTAAERTWLRNNPVIRVGADADWAPVEFLGKDGRYHGLAIDYLNKIQALLGVRFVFIHGNWQELIQRAKQRELDMFGCIARTPEREQYLVFTDAYIEMPIGIFAGRDIAYIANIQELSGKKVAVVHGHAIHEFLAANYPDIDLALVSNIEAGLQRITEGRATAFIDNILTTGRLISRKGYSHLKLIGEIPYSYKQTMGVRKDWPVFRDILQKGLDTISDQERNEIYRRWVSISYEKGFDYSLIWKIAGGGAFVFVLILYWNRKLAKEVEKRTRAIAKTNQQYQEAQSIARLGHWELDLVNGGLEWSDEIFNIFEVDKTKFTVSFEAFLERVHPDDRKEVDDEYDLLLKGKTPCDITHRLLMADGRIKWVHEKSNTEFDPSGTPLLTIGTVQDITRQIETEEKLRSERDFIKLLIHASPAFFVAIGADGKVIMMNKAMAAALGYDPEEVVGKNYMETFVPRADREALGAIFRKIIVAMEETVNENHALTRDGRELLVEWHGCPVPDTSGKVTYFICVGMDITEQVKMEKQIQQAQKMEAIGTLAGGIAHDFNNILSPIMGFAELAMARSKEDPMLQKCHGEILTASNRARELVAQILNFSRRTESELQPVQIHIIVKEALKLLRSSIPSSIEIKQNITGKALVMSDPTQIHQIVMNLCTNAWHAMRAEGGVLSVGLENTEFEHLPPYLRHLKQGAYLKLTVKDTGYGIAPDTIKSIFDPYFTTKEKGEGTGLGLAIVNGIVQKYGGAVDVTSKPGISSTFDVYLPIIDVHERQEEKKTKALPTGSGRILVVDDEGSIVSMMQHMLEVMGYEVTTETNSLAALSLFRKTPDKFDLIITDHTMPKMSGAKLAEEIEKVNPAIPIIIITGFNEEFENMKAHATDSRIFLQKPITIRELGEGVRAALQNAK